MSNLVITENTGEIKDLTVKGMTVTTIIKVRRNATAPEHRLQIQLDFSKTNEELILKWAARTRIIDMQRSLRRCTEEFLRSLKGKIINRDAMQAGEGFDDPDKAFQRTLNNVNNLTAEQRAMLLEQLMASGGGENE